MSFQETTGFQVKEADGGVSILGLAKLDEKYIRLEVQGIASREGALVVDSTCAVDGTLQGGSLTCKEVTLRGDLTTAELSTQKANIDGKLDIQKLFF